MALSTLSGSSKENPVSPAPSSNDYVKGDVDVTVTSDKRVVDDGPVRDTHIHSNVMEIHEYGPVIAQLRQYVEGTPILVTYYHLNASEQIGSNDTDIQPSSIEPAYTRINDFELRVQDEFSFSYLTEENISQYVGNAIMYPGFVPHHGDFFLYQIEPGTVGQIKITSVNRLSIRAQTCHAVSLELVGFVDQAMIDELQEQVFNILYFDIRAYLEGSTTFLETSERRLLRDIDVLEGVILPFYINRFFDTDEYKSFIRPDGAHDPYLADFMMKVLDYEDFPTYPMALIDMPQHQDRSFWAGLLNRNSIPTGELVAHYKVVTYNQVAEWSRLNALLNRNYLVLCGEDEDDAEAYISDGLVSMDGAAQSEFDRLVRMYYEQRLIDPVALLTQAQNYYTLEPMDQFYRIPVFMFLLTLLKKTIFDGTGQVAYGDSVTYYPTEYEFTYENLSNEYLIVRMPNKAIGVIDNDGIQWKLASGEVRYSPDLIHVNLFRILRELDGVWMFRDDAQVVSAEWEGGSNVITVSNAVNLEEGMAVESISGIPAKAYITAIDGLEVTLNEATDDANPWNEADVTMGFPIFEGTWKLVLTGNTVPSE